MKESKIKARVQAVYSYLLLKYPEWSTKEEIAEFTGISERTVRDTISRIRYKVPVMSYATRSGYKLALNPEDLEDAEHTLAELESRRQELALLERPLIIFKKYGGHVKPIKEKKEN